MSSWLVCLAPLSFVIQCLSLLLIWLVAIYVMAGAGLHLLPWSPVALHVNAKNQLNITRKDGQSLSDLSLNGDSIVTPWLTILQFRPKDAIYWQRLLNHSVLILPDSTDAQSFRQLRVWMLWGQRDKVR
ncbi:hypothetical protein C3Y98_08885 [Methylotenera oryzisoli]|uniref:Toxin CptA n=2 Tax=Methylotenera oryzisoli TaxID=2080758 RepID=A0A4Y9VR47_9PROT|nr:protein YgfX [Methylotenera oryzisoli]TFW70779.1 hypothetical protein C3Y98_08885 [Methylotenera oryzisoli]